MRLCLLAVVVAAVGATQPPLPYRRPVALVQPLIPPSPTGCDNPRLIRCANAFAQTLGVDGISTQVDELLLALDSVLEAEDMDGLRRVCKSADEFSMCIENQFEPCFAFDNLRVLDVMFSDSVGFRGIVSAMMEECMAMTGTMDEGFTCAGKTDGLYVSPGQDCTRDHLVCVEGQGFHMMCPPGQAVNEEQLCMSLDRIPRCAGRIPERVAKQPEMSEFTCPARVGHFPNPDKRCSMLFMSCALGRYSLRSCRAGYFDSSDNTCKPKHLISECQPMIPPPPPPRPAPVQIVEPPRPAPLAPEPIIEPAPQPQPAPYRRPQPLTPEIIVEPPSPPQPAPYVRPQPLAPEPVIEPAPQPRPAPYRPPQPLAPEPIIEPAPPRPAPYRLPQPSTQEVVVEAAAPPQPHPAPYRRPQPLTPELVVEPPAPPRPAPYRPPQPLAPEPIIEPAPQPQPAPAYRSPQPLTPELVVEPPSPPQPAPYRQPQPLAPEPVIEPAPQPRPAPYRPPTAPLTQPELPRLQIPDEQVPIGTDFVVLDMPKDMPSSPTGCDNERLMKCGETMMMDLGLAGFSSANNFLMMLNQVLQRERVSGLERICDASAAFSECINAQFRPCFSAENLRSLSGVYSDVTQWQTIISDIYEQCWTVFQRRSTFTCKDKPSGIYINRATPCGRQHVSCVGYQMFSGLCPPGQSIDTSSEQCLPLVQLERCQFQTQTFEEKAATGDMYAKIDAQKKIEPPQPTRVLPPPSPPSPPRVDPIIVEPPRPVNPYQRPQPPRVDPIPPPPAPRPINPYQPEPVVGKPTDVPKEMEFDCIGREDGNYYNPKKKCSQFYISCSGGELLWRACPEGLKFEHEVEACLPEDFVRACGGNPDLATTTLPPLNPSTREPVPFDCEGLEDGSYYDTASHCSNRYFRCSGEEATMAFCPENLVYDGTMDKCEVPGHVISCGGSPPLPTTTTPAPTTIDVGPPFDCSNAPDGNYANPQQPCSYIFVSCSGGSKTTIHCAKGMAFDVEINQCMPPEEIPACGGQPTVPTVPTVRAETTPVTPHPLFDCTDKADGNYPSERHICSYSFYSCVGGLTTVRDCPEHQAYDPERDMCDQPIYVRVCGGATTTTTLPPVTPARPEIILFDCEGLLQGDYADPKSVCSMKYYSCVGERGGKLRECADMTYFDEGVGRCVFYEQHPGCTGTPRTIPTVPTTYAITTTTPRVPEVDFACPDAGNFPDPLSLCSPRYVACAGFNAFPEVLECALGTFYDAELGQCGRFAEVPVCSGQPRPTTPEPLDEKNTPPPLPVDCSVRPDGFYKPQDRPCPKFFVQCRYSQGIRIDCPKGLAYSSDEETCVPFAREPTCEEDFEHE